MRRSEFRVAQQYLQRQADEGEFWEWMRQYHPRVPNPDPQKEDIAANTLKGYASPGHPQAEAAQRIVQRYRKQYQDAVQQQQSQSQPQQQQSREEITRQNLDIAKHGKIVDQKPLSKGGGAGGMNQSHIVTLEHNGKKQTFIYKPAAGENDIFDGIPRGTYHKREQAAYTIDSLLGGRGIVPVTQTQGDSKGSFQLWSTGARQLFDNDLDALREKVTPEQLAQTEDYKRLQVLDLLMGHEDRYAGNLLYSFDGEEKPENLRLIAIDNGQVLGGKSGGEKHNFDAFDKFIPLDEETMAKANEFYEKDEYKKGDALLQEKMGANAQRMAELRGDVLKDLPPKLHKQLQEIKLEDMAKAMTGAGIDDEVAVRGALVRLVALQEDPKAFAAFLDVEPDTNNAIKDFLNESLDGYEMLPDQEDDPRVQKIEAAMKAAKPKGGWQEPPPLSEPAGDLQDDIDEWAAQHGVIKWGAMVSRVAALWMVSKVSRDTRRDNPKGNKLTVSRIDMKTRNPVELATFELDRNGKVKESYKDPRFKFEVRRGVPILGKRVKPEDGAPFMVAIERLYGQRTFYEVRRHR